jgi:glycosyltransferase involved in cell wall biosynthesis
MMADRPDLTVVIPCYNSTATIAPLVAELAALHVPDGLELVLVNDGSADATAALCTELTRTTAVPVTFVDLARNYGEHNAVMAGLRFARGRYIITADDDGQNPPSEIEKLYQFARTHPYDVVYTWYGHKRHDGWRNLGSWLSNRVADLLLDKPRGLYLSSFRCMSAFVAEQITRYDGPYPYVDGLIFQVTRNVGRVEVAHAERRAGRSTYTLRNLAHLWLNLFMNFSVVPLRVSAVLGVLFSVVGFAATVEVVLEALLTDTPPGWGSFMSALLVFAGVQLLTIGLVGEYVGRMYLTINRRPQSVVRAVVRSPERA